MAQHAPITNIATTTGLTSGALGIYMHHAWEALLIMSSVSLILMSYGHARLLMGKRALAQQSKIKRRTSKIDIIESDQNHKFNRVVRLAFIKH